jgi:hypothetical protein
LGARPYQYVVDYDEDPQSALDRLRDDVFRKGSYRGASRPAASPDEVLARSDACGTRSILDIVRIAPRPAPCAAAPLSVEELVRFFGTTLPTLSAAEASDAFWEAIGCGQACYLAVLVGQDKRLLFAGYSFD